MFLRRIQREKPQFVNKYKKYCAEKEIDYLEADFKNFWHFFLSHDIKIEVVGSNKRFEGVITPYMLDGEEKRCDSFENKRDAEFDVVYRAFLLLDEYDNNQNQ